MVNVLGFYVNPNRIPVIGSTIYNAGQVYDVLVQPCGVDTYISVLAFFNYIPRLAWSIYKPTPLDTFTELLGRRKKKRRKRRFRVDLLEIPVDTGKKGSVRWVTWKIFGAAERLGWYFIVIDSTVDFAVNWSSMAYTFSGCALAGTPACQNRNTLHRDYFSLGTAVQVAFDIWGPGTIWSSNAGGLNCFTSGPKMAAGGCSPVLGFRNPKATFQKLEIVKYIGGAPVDIVEVTNDSPDPADWGAALVLREWSDTDAGSSYQMWITQSFGWAAYNSAYMSASGTLDEGFTWDP